MNRKTFLTKRALEMVLTLFFILLINFTLIHLAPGDVTFNLGGELNDPDYREMIRRKYGLDKSIFEQFVIYLQQLIRGDLGYSYARGRPVIDLIASRLFATVLLIVTALSFAVLWGVLTGVFAAKNFGSKIDRLLISTSMILYSIPVFWLGILLILLLSLHLGWFPVSGMTSVDPGERGLIDILRHLFLPALTLSLIMGARYVPLTRASMHEKSKEDFVRTYRAIGYKERTIFMRRVLKNAFPPVFAVIGADFGLLLSGAVLTEATFSWPGMGRLMYDAIMQRDVPMVTGCFLFVSVVVIVVTFLVDIIHTWLDPRIVMSR